MATCNDNMMCSYLWLFAITFVYSAGFASAQNESVCYGPGSMAASVILTLIFTLILAYILYVIWKKYKLRKGQHLILEKDPEKGKDDYAFDNPGFKDAGLTPIGKALEKNSKLDSGKTKWNQWSPLAALTTKHEKRKTLDDTAIEGNEIKIVSLRSHDFTGLGFNICGNMRDGIYIKDILHRGPASESGKLSPGDRINSVTISFEHMVYEDALTILSYASPYEVIIEAKSGKLISPGGQTAQPGHPLFKSSSSTDLFQIGKSAKKRLFQADDYNGSVHSSYSSLQKTRSNATTLERSQSKSPKPACQKPDRNRKPNKIQLSPEQLKAQLEQKIIMGQKYSEKMNGKEPAAKIEVETQKSENRFQKFGVKVFPNEQQISPKSAELSQNDNNINLERQPDLKPAQMSIDEVDVTVTPPSVKRREKQSFERQNSLNGSGIKRDKDGIPQEIPNHMMNAAMAARKNRKSSIEKEDTDVSKTPKKQKGKAPAPPEEKSKSSESIDDLEKSPKTDTTMDRSKEYNSDSDMEADNQSSVNTIELNASDITIHQSEESDEKQNRRTASTGDLTKIQKTRKTSSGTLERAQSLDITDTTMPTLNKKRKAGRIEDNLDSKTNSDESLYGKALIKKEPRLSLILDGLNTFQRSRLKKSTEWGNLEDAILKLNNEDNNVSNNNSPLELSFNGSGIFEIGNKSPEFDALVNKINEIKKESPEKVEEKIEKVEKKVKNQIWPTFTSNDETDSVDLNLTKEINIEVTHTKPKGSDEIVEIKTEENIVEEIKMQDSEETPKVVEEEKKVRSFIPVPNVLDLSRDFIKAEQQASAFDKYMSSKLDDMNVSDDIKVSRHSLGSLEKPKSDDVKLTSQIPIVNRSNISNITISDRNLMNGDKVTENNYPSLEINVGKLPTNTKFDVSQISTSSELYTTALDEPAIDKSERIVITTPDLIKNVTIAEAIHDLNSEVTIDGPSSFEIPGDRVEISETTFTSVSNNKLGLECDNIRNNIRVDKPTETSPNKNSTLTYITEIQVLTPNNGTNKNISEIEIVPNMNVTDNLDHEFEKYVKNFETNSFVEETPVETKQPKSITIDPEKELHKIQEIAEEQLKKLPEMRFTTSSYESPKTHEKRQSQIELLRSNFEKSPTKSAKSETPTKSRIPIATGKTPPTSPERRDSRNLDLENDKALLEMMSSSIHSTPAVNFKYQPKHTSNKNVTVTSIRNNSKIPSGLPTLGGSKPPVPPRRSDSREDGLVHISTNGGTESSFKQWVFNPSDSVTNIVVTENEQK